MMGLAVGNLTLISMQSAKTFKQSRRIVGWKWFLFPLANLHHILPVGYPAKLSHILTLVPTLSTLRYTQVLEVRHSGQEAGIQRPNLS